MTTWLNNYLAKRTQAVVVNGSESSTIPVLSGVPQGSLLGPLLFLIYIDHLPTSIANACSKVNLSADDVLLYHAISEEADYEALQTAISLIESWSISNYLAFNTSKCKCMVISRKPTLSYHMINCNFLECRCKWSNPTSIWVDLLSSNMSWSPHIESICSKQGKS